MKIIADLGKLTKNKNLIVIEKANHLEYVIASNYNADEGCWSSGEYYYSLDGIAEAILYYKRLMGYMRLQEIAEKAMSYLNENNLLEDFLEDTGVDLEEDEKEYFGVNDEEE